MLKVSGGAGQIFRLLYSHFRDLDGPIYDQICCILRKEDELEKLGVVGVNYGSQEPITRQLRLNYDALAPFSRHNCVQKV